MPPAFAPVSPASDPGDVDPSAQSAFVSTVPGDTPAADAGPVARQSGVATPVIAGPLTAGAGAADDNSDLAVHGDLARSLYGVDGTGITIGILSDSFNLDGGLAADQADGDLPASVNILKEGPSGNDEGRAMAELIHRIAPGATIDFYTAFDSETDFAAGITALAGAGCKVIVDDVYYTDEPFYQNAGPVTIAAEQAVAGGVSYFTAAGNWASNFYEAAFNPVQNVTLPGIAGTETVHEVIVNGADTPFIQIDVAAGQTLDETLEWDQPYQSTGGGQGSSYGLAVAFYDSNFTLLHVSENATPIGEDPDVSDTFTNTSTTSRVVYMAFYENAGTVRPGEFKIIFPDSGVLVTGPLLGQGSGSAFGHALATGVNAVGAINYQNTPAFSGTGAPEYFTSSGPGSTLLDEAGDPLAAPVTPGAPAFLAPDGSNTSVFAPFSGTSAAAPNAAAVAALMLQANPALTPAEVTQLLEQTASPDPGFNPDVTGAGIIQADQAVAAAIATACYLRGTRIATPDGDREIEDLRPGDDVLTLSGAARPIRWIGRRSYAAPFASASVQPVCIAAGGLAHGVPARDLFVSPRHAMLVDDRLIAAEDLVDGRRITRVQCAAIHYFHIELDTHDVILAEGAPSETYRDTGNRWMFENAGLMIEPSAASRGTVAPCVPYARPASRRPHTVDPDPYLQVGSEIIEPISCAAGCWCFVIPPLTHSIVLCSRSAIPADRLANGDARRLGLAVHALIFRTGTIAVRLDSRDAALRGGFHGQERGLRWTDGAATISVPPLLAPGGTLALHATALPDYPALPRSRLSALPTCAAA